MRRKWEILVFVFFDLGFVLVFLWELFLMGIGFLFFKMKNLWRSAT